MTQQLNEYQNFVRSLEATAQSSVRERLLHGALGLASEAVEFQLAKSIGEQVKESGDICYFLTVIVDALGGKIEKLEPAPSPKEMQSVSLCIENILSEIKRRAFYGKQKLTDEELIFGCNMLLTAALYDCDFVLDVNMMKLRARYPAGRFDPSDAMARADEAAGETKVA